MTKALFRQEAIDAQRTKIWGEVTLALPLSTRLIVCFLVLAVAGLIGFVSTGTYARKQHVPGFLATRRGVASILATRGGTITEVHVREGQIVSKGAPLLTIKVEQENETGSGNDTATLENLRLQSSRIEQQESLEVERTKASLDRLTAEINALTHEIDALGDQKSVQSQRTTIASDQVASITDLVSRNIITKSELKKRQDALLTAQQAELDIKRTIDAKTTDLGLKRRDVEQLPLESQQRLSQLQAAMDEIKLKIRQADGQRAYLVTAPKDGRVSALQAWAGKTAETNVPQMSIVPVDDVLTAELFVPAQAIGFVAPGQTVHLSYASFPYQQYGFAEGTVETVAYTLLKPDQSVGPIALTAPAYRISVSLKQQTIAAYGRDVPLQADMQLSADIVFDRRSLLAWLVDPLLASWRRPA